MQNVWSGEENMWSGEGGEEAGQEGRDEEEIGIEGGREALRLPGGSAMNLPPMA